MWGTPHLGGTTDLSTGSTDLSAVAIAGFVDLAGVLEGETGQGKCQTAQAGQADKDQLVGGNRHRLAQIAQRESGIAAEHRSAPTCARLTQHQEVHSTMGGQQDLIPACLTSARGGDQEERCQEERHPSGRPTDRGVETGVQPLPVVEAPARYQPDTEERCQRREPGESNSPPSILLRTVRISRR